MPLDLQTTESVATQPARPVSPRRIRLEAASACQLRCPSCPTTSGAIRPAVGTGVLKLGDFRTLLDANPSLDHVELSNYGEVFLNPHLLGILEHAHSRGVTLAISNGANLNHVSEAVLEALVKYKVRHITCSIDGASDATYKIYRVRGSYDKVIANIERINHYKQAWQSGLPTLAWQFVVFGHNEHEIPAARARAAELDMSFNTKLTWDSDFSPIRDKAFVQAQIGDEAVTRAEYAQTHGSTYMGGLCHQLWDEPQINWDGKVLGCCRNFWGDFGGNAFVEGLIASVNSEKMTYARAMLTGRASARDDIPCTTCEIYRGMRDRSQFMDRG